MKALQEKATELGEQAQRAKITEIAEELRTELPDANVDETADGVEVRGESLLRRWLEDSSIRFASRRRT